MFAALLLLVLTASSDMTDLCSQAACDKHSPYWIHAHMRVHRCSWLTSFDVNLCSDLAKLIYWHPLASVLPKTHEDYILDLLPQNSHVYFWPCPMLLITLCRGVAGVLQLYQEKSLTKICLQVWLKSGHRCLEISGNFPETKRWNKCNLYTYFLLPVPCAARGESHEIYINRKRVQLTEKSFWGFLVSDQSGMWVWNGKEQSHCNM